MAARRHHCATRAQSNNKHPPPSPHAQYLTTFFLPFFSLTSAAGVAYGVPRTDLTTRLAVLGSFFIAHLSLRFVLGPYLPRISYSTMIDTYVQLCLMFILAAVVEVVVAAQIRSPESFAVVDGTFSPNGTLTATMTASGLLFSDTFPACPGCPFPLDQSLWLALGVLWAITNLYFSHFFLGREADSQRAMRAKLERAKKRRSPPPNGESPTPEGTYTCSFPSFPVKIFLAARQALFIFCVTPRRGVCFQLMRVLWLFFAKLIAIAVSFLPYLADTVVCCGNGRRCLRSCCIRATGLTCAQWWDLHFWTGFWSRGFKVLRKRHACCRSAWVQASFLTVARPSTPGTEPSRGPASP